MLTMEQRLRMLETPQTTFDLVIDTDAYNEIDDQFAISYALRAQDRLHLLALCAAPFHNERSTGPADGMEKSYQEILKLLSLAVENVPVYRGSTAYLPDEKTPVPSDAAQALVRLAMEHTTENPLYVAAIGAITNVASALLLQPEIADRMVLVWLGGSALHWPDNQEFNVLQDVAAARVAFDSGVPLVLLPRRGHAFHHHRARTGILAPGKKSPVRLSGAADGGRRKRLRERPRLEPGDLGRDHYRLAVEPGGEVHGGPADPHAHSPVRSPLQ